jgi:hypothetical protein
MADRAYQMQGELDHAEEDHCGDRRSRFSMRRIAGDDNDDRLRNLVQPRPYQRKWLVFQLGPLAAIPALSSADVEPPTAQAPGLYAPVQDRSLLETVPRLGVVQGLRRKGVSLAAYLSKVVKMTTKPPRNGHGPALAGPLS